MTSAHRPTWAAALGGSGLRDGAISAPTYRYSSKDLAAHTKLKFRQIGQDAPEEVGSKDLKHELLGSDLLLTEDLPAPTGLEMGGDIDADIDEEDLNNSPEEEGNEEDDTTELLRELEKIKKERAEEAARKAALEESKVIHGNPLLNLGMPSGNIPGAIKRRWNDDVVFKNQARGVDDEPAKRFINDTTRSDFHRKFLNKYVR
jgi:protein CWC15